jgi:hypothetical protein
MWGFLGVAYVVVGAALLLSAATSVWIGVIVALCLIALLGFAWVTSD